MWVCRTPAVLKASLRTQTGASGTFLSVSRSLLTRTSDPFDPRASEVIDVRAEQEYEYDHIPGAVNLPVLTSEQRAVVGELYARDRFEARKLGAGLVAASIGRHLAGHFRPKAAHYRPLLYCWRAGQRSQSLAVVLERTGFEVLLLDRGYRAYRGRVVADLAHLPGTFTYVVITGLTGSGKTMLLHALAARGQQVLDLEGLACHKGSLLGGRPSHPQPSQKRFESLLRCQLATFDPARPVWVESESSRVGRLQVPGSLFERMRAAPRVEVSVPLEVRVQHILRDYRSWTQDLPALKGALLPLKKVRGGATLDAWFRLAEGGRWGELVERLLVEHYDGAYIVSQRRNDYGGCKTAVQLCDLSPQSQSQFVDRVVGWYERDFSATSLRDHRASL